jgi:hypothetical protein
MKFLILCDAIYSFRRTVLALQGTKFSKLAYSNLVRTSQETHYVSATEANRLILYGETVAVSCRNHTEHTDTVLTSQEAYYVSATELNRLMMFGETVTVYCENHTEHRNTVHTWQETHYISAREPNRLILFENHAEHRNTVHNWQETYYVSDREPNRLMLFRETVAVYCVRNTQLHCVGRMQNYNEVLDKYNYHCALKG